MSLSEVRPASGNAAFEGVDAVRADGGLVHIRPVATSDANALRTLHARVSDRSMYLRFLALGRSAGEVRDAADAAGSTRIGGHQQRGP
ncbi:MAG TPA: hypothetical protein VES60_10365 [Nakamurella sp.]|nr:hypothetical protein [Nakamurella sp.]